MAFDFEEMGSSLEDAFFLKQDKDIIENLKKMKAMKETRESLREASGIEDEKVLGKLIELNIRPETVAALSLIPLVEIAWADGEVHEREKKAVVNAAVKVGLKKGSVELKLIESWMNHKPSSDLFEIWKKYTLALCSRLTAVERAALKSEITGHARAVAEAYGGFLGMGAVSPQEEAVIKALENSFTCD